MKIAIGSDKSGFSLKEAVKAYLSTTGDTVDDFGTIDPEKVIPYYAVAATVAEKIQSGEYDRGILICGTGAGMNIVANKFNGVHAVSCESIYSAKMERAINNAQVLCMGGWIVAPELGIEMAKTFLATDYLEDVEEWRKVWLTNAAAEAKKLEDSIYAK